MFQSQGPPKSSEGGLGEPRTFVLDIFVRAGFEPRSRTGIILSAPGYR
jgi:hypothetical protein